MCTASKSLHRLPARRSTCHYRSKLRLGILPTADRSARRTANIITWPNHEVWTKRSGGELLEYLQASFPQLPLR
jgi:kynurenine 3-monooxygenase